MKDSKILKLAQFSDNPEITQFETIIDMQEDIEELENKLTEATQKICEDIYAIEKPQDHSDKLDAILSKLNQEEPDEEIIVTLNII